MCAGAGAIASSFARRMARSTTCRACIEEVVENRRLSLHLGLEEHARPRVPGHDRTAPDRRRAPNCDFRHDRFFDQQARDNHERGWAGNLCQARRLSLMTKWQRVHIFRKGARSC